MPKFKLPQPPKSTTKSVRFPNDIISEVEDAVFNSITDAIDALQRQNYIEAQDILIRAQQDAEEMYLADACYFLCAQKVTKKALKGGFPP